MSRGDSLARQLQLMQILETRRELVVPEVAVELGYTQRTVYRDLAVLERIGVPIYQERRGKQARWRVVEGYRRKLSVTLSWPELLALTVARKLVAGLEQTPLAEAAESALGKLSRAMPAELAERAARASAGVSATLGAEHDYGQKGSAVRALVDAIERQETVQLQYRKRGERSAAQRRVDPYLLHVQAGAVYLIGFCHLRNGVRTFLLDRVREAKSTGAVFAAKAPFSAAAVLQGALGPWQGEAQRMKLRFDAEVADLVAERRVHPSQRSQWTSEGELDVELRAPVCPPLLAWLLGWGEHVRVVSPEALARKLRRRHALASK
jgi:predicted DNA-binding transcriptional regulator YafY